MGASHPASSWWPRLTALAGLVVTAAVIGALGVVLVRGFVSWRGPADAQDWASRPLEVVAEGSQQACMLNVDALAPGDHDVLVVAVDSPSQVSIEDPSGAEIFRAARTPVGDARPGPAPRSVLPPTPRPGSTPSPVAGSVTLDVGIYQVVCAIDDGATASVPLRVRPAGELD